jgi:diguanylate cyclase (GGDEF)-like protein
VAPIRTDQTPECREVVGFMALRRPAYLLPYLAIVVGLGTYALLGRAGDPFVGLLYLTAAVAGLALSVRAARHPALSVTERRPWRYLGVGFAFMPPMGVASGAGYTGPTEGLSVALAVGVLCRLVVTVALVCGLLAFLTEPLTRAERSKIVLDSVTVVGGGLMVLWYLLIAPALRADHHLDPRTVSATTFAVVDLVLLLGYALLAVAAVRSGAVVWMGLVAGSVVMTFGVAARQVIALRENHELIVTDSLTQLANRTRLRTALDRAVARGGRTGRRTAVLLIDLNGFKQLNDAYGHEAGDELLVAFGAVLRRSVRASDTPARLGGDEFVVVLAELAGAHEAVAVAERILAEAARPVTVAGRSHAIRASIGIAVSDPERPTPPNELLHRADQAMYAAKRKHPHGWQLWGVDGAGDDELRADLVADVAAGQFTVMYQPIVDLRRGDLVAVEALARWEHPVRGPVPPSTFIPLAEEAGVVHELGMCVLEQAARQVRRWQRRLPAGRALRLSVNVSAYQLGRDTLAAEVAEVLARTGFDPRHLVVEITETEVVDDDAALPQLTALRAAGTRIALDDFGTGYSSLRHLTRLPVDVLKLDRCFVAELNGETEGSAVAEAVIRLAQVLRLETVAEGIEKPAQATELTLLGCHSAQGYHFAAPLAPERVDELIGASVDAWPHLPSIVPARTG